ncbi:NADPH oxidase organizer 1 [Bagarius yarrelli]|uniref:NADPH oxidase organizer 1 n=1 Tax=Bagarius yarrelli TaxID=175774 RepID=A0A556TIU8_BAGYA|nr:NADPH oxidase organizer 1 [Bagarius yarrelli]
MGDDRYPLDVRIRGFLYKGNSKLYMASVLWSDQTEVIVYRSLRDFKQLHRTLKKTFPVDNLSHQQDRVLPRFGGLLMKLNLKRNTPAKCVHRVKSLERYCTELLRCTPRVTRSSVLIHFFIPKEEELHPAFAQNRVYPEDDENDQPTADLKSKRFSVGNVSQPFITKLYRCLAPYETKDTKNQPFSVKVNETLEVLIKDEAGWWLVENEQKHLAWFPAPYLELCEDEEERDEEVNNTGGQMSLYCAIRNYTSNMKDEISVNIGAVVEVIQKSDNGWWLVRYNGKAGYVPSIYLQPYTNPMFKINKKLNSSSHNLSTVQSHPTHKSHFYKSHSLEVISELPSHIATFHCNKPSSRKSSLSDDTDFCSSPSISLGLSINDSEEEESPGESEKGLYSPDSVLSVESRSPTNSETSSLSKHFPQVPPRPQTQEILTRCTTYTRKAALETQARLFKRTHFQAL